MNILSRYDVHKKLKIEEEKSKKEVWSLTEAPLSEDEILLTIESTLEHLQQAHFYDMKITSLSCIW